ncbi:hypothetical protein [Yeosuana marina]|uniref:hypothetical protein n=1 Tax=Yeosuana marina TaxID=1565536 RepID=UPI0030C89889
MSTLKKTFTYLIWVVLSLLIGITYMRLIVGPVKASKEGLGYLLHMFSIWGIFQVGLIIGSVIAFLFIILDVVYLKKKLKYSVLKSTIIRFSVLIVITGLVAFIHYLLEKVLDVI